MANENQPQQEAQKRIAMFLSMLESGSLARLLSQLNQRERVQLIETYEKFAREASPGEKDLMQVAKSFLQTKAVNPPNRFKQAMEIAFGPGAAMPLGSSARWAEIAETVKPSTMAEFLTSERPHTTAIVLSQLPPGYAATVLPLLPEDLRCEAVATLAGGMNFSDEVFDAVLAAVEESLGSMKTAGDPDQGARQAAAMLNQIDSEIADAIVDRIRQRNPRCAESIEGEMFHFEDLIKLDNRSLQMVLAELKTERLALALKGTQPNIQEAMFGALAEQVKKMVVQEMDDLGKVPARDVSLARREIVDTAMQMARDGKIRIRQEEDLVG